MIYMFLQIVFLLQSYLLLQLETDGRLNNMYEDRLNKLNYNSFRVIFVKHSI